MHKIHCHACGKNVEKTRLCSRCKVGRYCSSECQRSHWSIHKIGCNIDSNVSKETLKVNIDKTCLHGALVFSKNQELLLPIVQFTGQYAMSLPSIDTHISSSRDNLTIHELTSLEKFCKEFPFKAKNKESAQVCFSSATDALGDNDLGIARLFIRAGIFLECNREYESFLIDIHLMEGERASLMKLRKVLFDTMSKHGIIQFL